MRPREVAAPVRHWRGWLAGIRGRLALVVLTVLLPLLVLEAATRYQDYRDERASALQSNLEMARAVAAVFESYVDDTARQEDAVGHALILLRPFRREQAHQYLVEAARDNAAMKSLSWADASGRIVASNLPSLVGSAVDTGPWSGAMSGEGWTITSVTRSHLPGANTFVVARGVRDERGQLQGVLVAAIDPMEIEGLRNVRQRPGVAISLVDGSGWLAFRLPEGETSDEPRDWGRLYPSVVGAALRGDEALGRVYDQGGKGYRYLSYVPVDATHWAAGAGMRESEVLGPILSGLYRDVGVMLLVSAAALLAATLVARGFLLPLQQVSDQAQALGEGDLKRRVTPEGPAELRALASTFNAMAQGLQAREQDRELLLHVERARAKEARLLRTMQDITVLGLAYLDRDFRFIHANATAARAAGIAAEDLVGRCCGEVIGGTPALAALERARASGETVSLVDVPGYSPTGRPEDGPTFWDITVIPVKDETGSVEGYVLSGAEVTDKVRAREQLLAGERARADVAEELLAEINHRMKNNLMVLVSVLGLQADQLREDSAAADPLRDAAARVSAISAVHERMYAGRSGRVELRDLLQRVAELSLQALSARDVALSVSGDRVEASSKAGATVSLLANELVTNAIKYGAPAPDGKRQVTVTLAHREGQVILRVWGSGNPIAPSFDVGRQRGMGLRLAQLAVEGELGGRLSLRAHEGGTLAEVTLDEAILRAGAVAPGFGIKRREQIV